tara:strand:+ start:1027 stop:2016 length:990 start_codon:yes stop_codon:yes gene_type:complete
VQWEHVKIKQSKIKGRKGATLANNIVKFLSKNIDNCNLLFIDWPLVGKVGALADKIGLPWICIDRSPPADSGIFAALQSRVWKKTWRYVSLSTKSKQCLGGTVVSKAHQDMISKKFQVKPGNLCILMAGVNLSQFITKDNNERLSGLNLVYHGRIDRNRGIMNLPLILEKLLEHDIDAKMHFIGDGDVYHILENISRTQPNLILHGKKNHDEIPKEICNYQIGLLPMPPISAWIIASPLKRSEYLASGLVVLGVNHSGHHLPCDEPDSEWYALVEQENFVTDAIAQIMKWNNKGNFTEMGLKSRTYAEENLDWNITVNSLTSWVHQRLE